MTPVCCPLAFFQDCSWGWMSGAGPRIRSRRCSPSTTASATSSRSVRQSIHAKAYTHTHTKKKALLFFSSSAALSASRIAFIRWRSFKALTSSPRFGFQRCPVNEILVHSPSNPASQSLHTVPYHSCYRYFTGCPCFSLLFFFFVQRLQVSGASIVFVSDNH